MQPYQYSSGAPVSTSLSTALASSSLSFTLHLTCEAQTAQGQVAYTKPCAYAACQCACLATAAAPPTQKGLVRRYSPCNSYPASVGSMGQSFSGYSC